MADDEKIADDEKLDRTELEREHSRRPEANPGNISEDAEPHHVLNNPVGEPDETEWPDPYEKREDPTGRGSRSRACFHQRAPSAQ